MINNKLLIPLHQGVAPTDVNCCIGVKKGRQWRVVIDLKYPLSFEQNMGKSLTNEHQQKSVPLQRADLPPVLGIKKFNLKKQNTLLFKLLF